MMQRLWKIGFGVLTAVLAAATVYLSFAARSTAPIVLEGSREALAAVQAMLEDVKTGDAEKISSHFVSGTDLKEYYQLQNPAANRLISYVWDNLEAEILSDAYAESGALAVDVKVTAPDAAALAQQMQKLAAPLLNAAVDEAENVDAIMGEDNQYQESFLQEVLLKAVDAATAFAAAKEQSFTVHVQCREGQWEILPEDGIINALSGWAK